MTLGLFSYLKRRDVSDTFTRVGNDVMVDKQMLHRRVRTRFSTSSVISIIAGQFIIKNVQFFGCDEIDEQNIDVKYQNSNESTWIRSTALESFKTNALRI